MKSSINYKKDYLYPRLKKKRYAVKYLNAALADDDPNVALLAIKDIVEARGGFTDLSRKTHISREHLYRMLSQKGNPSFKNLVPVLHAYGLELAVK